MAYCVESACVMNVSSPTELTIRLYSTIRTRLVERFAQGKREVNKMYWVTGILGLLLAAAPFLVGYVQNTPALIISVGGGVLVMVMSVLEGLNHEREKWEYWVALVLGVGIISSPFLFGFNNHFEAVWTTLILGMLIALGSATILYINSSKNR